MTARATLEIIEDGHSRWIEVPPAGAQLSRGARAGAEAAADGGMRITVVDDSVSRQHAMFAWQGDDLWVIDLGSARGIHRDGVRTVEARLDDGAELIVGDRVAVRVSLAGGGGGTAVAELADTAARLQPATAAGLQPAGTPRGAPPLLGALARALAAPSAGELAIAVAAALGDELGASRAVVLELDDRLERMRVTGRHRAGDASFVSRTVLREACEQGSALHLAASSASMVIAESQTAMAVRLSRPGEPLRVFYADTQAGVPQLGWDAVHAVVEAAPLVGAAFAGSDARAQLDRTRRDFEELRRYFSPTVADHVLAAAAGDMKRPRLAHGAVLFADLSGYTALTEELQHDLDQLFRILNRWLEAGVRAVHGHGGILDKFIGDAVMGVFGVPAVSTNPARQAVNCALRMRERVAALSSELGRNIQITVGIAVGPLLAGSIGADRRLEFTVLGDTVNVAARIQGKAAPGQILVTGQVADVVRDDIAMRSLGESSLKNRREPVTVWEILDG